MKKQAIEDYLKIIYKLEVLESPVSTSRLAEARRVKAASATNMMKRLAELGYVTYAKSRGVTLTAQGRLIALEVLRHHRLIELYLTRKLDFRWDEVHEQAEVLEHFISEALEERIADMLGHPHFDPHGDPIPTKCGQILPAETVSLATLKQGSTAIVKRVLKSWNSEFLSYLAQLGMVPGAEVLVVDVAPFNGPFTLEIDKNSQIVGHKIAQNIHVQVNSNPHSAPSDPAFA